MYLIIYVCFIGIVILIIQILFNEPEQKKETTVNYAICGNSTSPEMKIGNNIFKENCAACHKLNKDFVGPALYDINERHKLQDKDFFFNFVTNEDSLKGNKYVDSLNEIYASQYNHKFNLNKDEVIELINFLN